MAEKHKIKSDRKLLEELLGLFYPSLAFWRTFEARLLQRLDYPSPVLDLGCGRGLFTKVIFKKIEVGLDNGTKDLAAARKINLYEQVHLASAEKIPYKADFFGTVLANCVMEHTHKPEKIVAEIIRVLKKGGIFILTVPASAFSLMLLFKNKRYVTGRNAYLAHYNLFSCKKWRAILTKYGFETIRTEGYLDKKTIKFWDLIEFIKSPFLWGKSPVLKLWEITPKIIWQKLLTRPLLYFLKRKSVGPSTAYLLVARKK